MREQLIEACEHLNVTEPFGVLALHAAEKFLEREIARRAGSEDRKSMHAERIERARRIGE